MNILVLGAGGTAGINFIECLLNYYVGWGYNVIGCDINQWHLKLIESIFGISCHLIDEIGNNDFERVNRINEIIETEKIDFIHAQPDIEVEFLSNNRKEINAKMFLPDPHTIAVCRNKLITSKLLGGLSPVSYSANDEGIGYKIQQLQSISDCQKVWLRAVKGAGSKAALPVTTEKQALDWIHYWIETHRLETEDFMISEYLPGKEYAFQSIWKDGELITSMARERIEYLMGNLFPSGQSSTPSVAKTVHNDKVNVIATQAVYNVDKKANGIFCVDMKEDQFGMPKVTEINAGRFFTTCNFFAFYGANMPDTYVKLGMGKVINELPKYNAIPKDITWIRGIDCLPRGIEDGN